MKRFIDFATVFFYVVVVLAVICFHCCQRQKLRAEISQLSDVEYAMNNLKLRNADDCRMTQIEGGWKCTEFKTGKVFIVRRP
jgi:hypothetical protein